MRSLLLSMVVIFGLCLAACGDGTDETEAIHGTWLWSVGVIEVSETFNADGTWYAADEYDEDWGTYTLEDGILTMTNADDSYCGPDSSAVYEVTFSEDGNELQEKIISESCGQQSIRGRDRVLVRVTP
jgi:hypothetical protein